jgi:hypothetical protein
LVDQAVFFGFLGRHVVVAVGVAFQIGQIAAAMFGEQAVELFF